MSNGGQAKVASPDSNMLTKINRLEGTTGELEEVIKTLENKLGPVLLPLVDPPIEGQEKDAPEESTFVYRLRMINDRASALVNQIQQIEARTEV